MTADEEVQYLVALGEELRKAAYRFVTVTPQTHRRVFERATKRREFEARSLRDVFGWNMPFDPALLPARMLESLQRAAAVESAGALLRSRVRFSTLGDALFVHSGYPTTEEDAVFFGPDTYRFCALLARAAPNARRIADVGCGSGAGGLSLASRCPERLVLCDINSRALRFSRVNQTLAGVPAEIAQSDVLQSVRGDFDLIVANPPYMQDSAARTYRHGGGDYGEALSARIVREALPRLAPGGVLILYTGSAVVNGADAFEASIRPILAAFGRVSHASYEELDPDVFGEELETPAYANVERIAAVGLTVRVSSE